MPMYSVLNTLSEYTYFNVSKTLLHTLLLLAFKIVESLECILKKEILVKCALHFRAAEAATGGFLWNKVFLKISQILQENISVGVPILKNICERLLLGRFTLGVALTFWLSLVTFEYYAYLRIIRLLLDHSDFWN